MTARAQDRRQRRPIMQLVERRNGFDRRQRVAGMKTA